MPHTRIYWLHTLSPTHAGVGRGVDYIDLPIDRDGVTGWPIIRGSSFKGVWADHHRATEDARKADTERGRLLKAAFGIASEDDTSNAGALIPTDARLVCLPVRSLRGTFGWATSSFCLEMLRRTLSLAGCVPLAPSQEPPPDGHAFICQGSSLMESEQIYLEDLDFNATPHPTAYNWADDIAKWAFPNDAAWQFHFKKRFVVLPDSAFDFLCETGTEVHTRVRIDDETKTVADKALWTEESLPAESILAGLIQCERVFQKNGTADAKTSPASLLNTFAPVAQNGTGETLLLQIGGKATVGRGQVRCVFSTVNGAT